MKTVDFETAKALQGLGYDGEYTHVYPDVQPYEAHRLICAAPRLDDAAYWLWGKSKMFTFVRIERNDNGTVEYDTYIYGQDSSQARYLNTYPDYESALESLVKKMIQIIKEKQK